MDLSTIRSAVARRLPSLFGAGGFLAPTIGVATQPDIMTDPALMSYLDTWRKTQNAAPPGVTSRAGSSIPAAPPPPMPTPSAPAAPGLSLPGFPAPAASAPTPEPALSLPGFPAAVPMPQPRPQAAPQAAPAVPMPQPRPADAPQAPEPMSWFQRNAYLQRDADTGSYLDPMLAAQANASGPDLIQKMMNYFHRKDTA